MSRGSKPLILLLALNLLATPVLASSLPGEENHGTSFLIEQLMEGLGIPWGMAFVSPSELLITERSGKLYLLATSNGQLTPIKGGPKVRAEGQGGLLDVAVPNGYQQGDWVYFTYSKAAKKFTMTTLARARHKDQRLTDWQDLLITQSKSTTSHHFGSRIAFDDQGHVFFSVGDRGIRSSAQDLSNHAGSILRLNVNGSIPTNNPFSDQRHSLPEIWSYGHRNIQGLAFDHKNQQLWAIEHGPRGGDEINLIQSGKNYGWPVISHGKEYWGPIAVGEGTSKPGMEQPRKVYIPSIAPGSLMLYTGDAFPHWQGNLFAGALKLRHLNRIVLTKNGRVVKEERLLTDLNERIRALVQSSEGWIYLSTDSGKILRLRPDH